MSRNLGYVRVSHKEQNEARQVIALEKEGIENEYIYIDKQSGKDFNRPQYLKLLNDVREGDCIFILSIDRLGRNYDEIIEQWKYITKELKVNIVVIDMPLLDTRKEKNLIGAFISDIVLQILSFVAQNERENIRSRQAAGIAAAKERGVKFGRDEIPITTETCKVYTGWKNGIYNAATAAALCNMSSATFYRKIGKIEEQLGNESM